MRWKSLESETCSVARTMAIIGDRWTMLILREAFLDIRKFEDLQKRLGIGRAILTDRLNKLIEHFVMTKVAYRQSPVRYEYQLTSKGRALFPIIVTMAQWGDTYLSTRSGRPAFMVHDHCHTAIDPALICPECKTPVDADSLRFHRGPGSAPSSWLKELPPSAKAGNDALQGEIERLRTSS